MASITKLSVRGVRSFSPNDDEQVIGFCFPLTIIVGANGCGKTTIIESLKYAVTGSLPPGNKSGQSFVHDPKSIGQSSVKAQIKLRFNNTEGSQMVVARSMEVSQKKTTASFKALDGTIRTHNRETGERVTMSHKCTELDRTVPMYLGVSKPILEHVVFCHQEDSSWPLQEGAVLKKRFDDIFDSTRYAKALEAIKAERKNYASVAKDLKAELEGLNSHKHAATGFREELEACKDKISGLEDKISEANEVIESERANKKEALEVITRIDEFRNDLDSKEEEIRMQEAVFDKQKELLGKEDMTEKHSYQELKDMLRELSDERNGSEASRLLAAKEEEYAGCERKVEKLRRKTNDLNSRRGKIEAERDAHSNVLRQRFKIMEEIHRTHAIEMEMTQDEDDDTLTQGTAVSRMSRSTIFTAGTSGTNAITQEDMEAFQRAVRAKGKELADAYGSAKRKHRMEEDEMQKDILDLEAQKAAFENDRKRNESAKSEAMRELTQISSQMSSTLTRVRKQDVDDAKDSAAKLAHDRDEMNNNPRREEITKEIRVLEDKLKAISTAIETDTKVRDTLRMKQGEQQEIDMLEKQVQQEYDVLKEMLRDQSYAISEQGENCNVSREDPVSPVDVLANNIRSKLLNAQDDVERQSSAVNDIQKKLSEKQALLGNHVQRLQQLDLKKKRLLAADGGVQKIKSTIRAIIRYDQDTMDTDYINEDSSPSEILKYLAEQVEHYSTALEKPEHITKVIKRLKKLTKNNPTCPCCTRDFHNDDEINAFAARMNELADPDVSELHAALSKKSGDVANSIEKYENWRRTISDNINDHVEHSRVIEEMKDVEAIIAEEEGGGRGSVDELQTELKNEEAALTEKKVIAKDLQSLMTAVSGIQDTAKRVWEKMGNVKEKKERLKFQFVGGLDDPRDLKTVEKDLSKSSDQKEHAYTSINNLNNEQDLDPLLSAAICDMA